MQHRCKRWAAMAVVALTLALTSGCAVFTDLFGQDEAGPRTAIQYATLKVIDDDTARADRVVEIVTEVRGLVSGDATATMDEIEARVRDEIDWSALDDAETLVVSNLIDEVRAEIQARIEGGELAPDERVAVTNVLDWIVEAARMAGGEAHADADEALDSAEADRRWRTAGAAFGHAVRARAGHRAPA